MLKHLKVTNTAFPLSSTFPLSSFQGTELALSKFALAALNKPNTKHEIRQELRHLSPPNPTVSIAVTRRTCWTVLSYARKSEKAVLQSRLTARPLINSLSHQPTNPPSCFGVTEAQFLPKELHTSHQLALLKFSRKARLDLASYSWALQEENPNAIWPPWAGYTSHFLNLCCTPHYWVQREAVMGKTSSLTGKVIL